MADFLWNYLLTGLTQPLIFIVLLGLYILQRRQMHLLKSGLSWLRIIIMLVLFFYFVYNYASEIPEALRRTSIVGMFCLNLIMVYTLLLDRREEKYRQALAAYSQDLTSRPLLDEVWRLGKKFIYFRYIFEALASGYSPGNFLQGVISRQIPTDIKHVLMERGIVTEVVATQTLINFLNARLKESESLPPELKDVLAQVIQQLGDHAWIKEQIDAFLQMALKDPEKLYHSAWSEAPRRSDA
ncbi:MAG TPA: hypothetical protein DCY27_14685 [Desulfobacterales bacterium]|nr:hypothetical protein [Desulfobacterales bacterium]